MASDLDRAIAATVAKLRAAGGPLETAVVEDHGVALPALARAPATLPDYFAHFCGVHGDRTFLVDGAIRLSFAETHAAAAAVAQGLLACHGLEKGERVGIAARNSANWVVAYMGVLIAGGCAVLLNGFWTGAELAEGVRMVGCRLVIADDARAERLAGQDIGGASVIAMVHDISPAEGFAALAAPGAALPALAGDDLATILFTSGSTGRCKGAWSDHRAVVQATMSYLAQTLIFFDLLTAAGAPPAIPPATLMNVPLFHVTGEVPVMLQSFAMGRKLVMMPRWDAVEAMRLIEAERVTYFTGVPLMSYEMMTHPRAHEFDLSSCTAMAAGGAPRPVEHVRRIKAAMGAGYPLLGYGLTETNAVGCGNFTENYLAKPDSTGPASQPIVEVAILAEDGGAVAEGETGEVGIRSIANFGGYWDDDAATAAAFTADRFFRTGDIGRLDADGYLFIVDRKKDIIIRGGENISCAEIEAAAYECPDIVELSVFPVADDRFGEVPGLVYLPRDGADLPPATLSAFLEPRLAPFKRPAHLWRADAALPRLGTQKIDRVTLRRDYNALVAAGETTGAAEQR